ncbi:hypothetical protein H072_4381 [Dactylellina haptotyla CBS 200.50]|uniref:Structure-specific endonuclease subunit SLX4 n=1 Tax=Dactylellina haptotyla (strain CBS 200.50) TaxID=1284197 RepID=S8AF54_DACHA|nr:hypothetical protein H072_4381 [Dactylellina haptotyla CBS 200.50]
MSIPAASSVETTSLQCLTPPFADKSSNSATPSRSGTRFRSVKDMLAIEELESTTLNATLAPADNLPTTSGKLKRPKKTSIRSKKSANIPSPSITTSALSAKDGKIKGKATKPSAISLTKKKTSTKKIDDSDVFAIPSSPHPTPQQTLLDTPPREATRLDAYIPAKRTWTPIKENTHPEVIDLCTPDDLAKTTFTSLLSKYKHDGQVSHTGVSTSTGCSSEPFTTRRTLEFLDIPSMVAKTSISSLKVEDEPGKKGPKERKAPAKAKKSKPKKPMTLTALAIAPYIPVEPEVELAPAVVEELATEEATEGTNAQVKPKRKRKQSATTSKKAKKMAKKPPVPVAPSLLSPQSARKLMDAQTFVFGTSSQLLQSNPPEGGWQLETTGKKLNTIQTYAKIHANANYDLDGLGDDDGALEASQSVDEYQCPQTECIADTEGWGISNLEITKNKSRTDRPEKIGDCGIWSMASRGASGKLLNVEVMDLLDEDDLELSQNFSSQKLDPETNTTPPATAAGSGVTANPSKKENIPTAQYNHLPTPPPTECASQTSKHKQDYIPAPTTSKLSDRPNFEGYTIIQLQTQIQKYGFKPVKSRKTMINMLNQCWDSAEVMVASQEDTTERPVEKVKTPTKGNKKPVEADASEGVAEMAPKKRGRKPKTAFEIEDGMEAPKPKRPRKSSTATKAKSKLDTATLFKHIALAIKQQPTSPDLTEPSWWQRILMNEIIPLQEFTNWLVETGMEAAGFSVGIWKDCGVSEALDDSKVDAVRLWCDARSVLYT